jgi:predicted DCC family thiol-disulfide oxidoreductase YuxK
MPEMTTATSDEIAGDPNASDVLYYDGNCAFCSGAVRFLNRRLHPNRNLRFVGLASVTGVEEVATMPEKIQKADSVILLRNDKPYIRSAAAIRALRHLRQPWPSLFPIFWLVPLPVRDLAYIIVAKLRHKMQARKMRRG